MFADERIFHGLTSFVMLVERSHCIGIAAVANRHGHVAAEAGELASGVSAVAAEAARVDVRNARRECCMVV